MSEREPIRPSRWTIGCNWLVLALLILPMTVVLPVSMTDRPYLSMPEHGLSLQHYSPAANGCRASPRAESSAWPRRRSR